MKKKLNEELDYIKNNSDEEHAKQLAEREAFLNAPGNAKMLNKVKLGMKIAKTVYDSRISAKLTQAELAEKLHTRQSYIAEVKKGRRNITISTLERYVEACGKQIELTLV